MRVSDLRIGTSLLGGRVYVIHLERQGAYSTVELTDGKTLRRVRLHKSQHIAAALHGVLGGQKSDRRSPVQQAHNVRASSPIWRGEWDDTSGLNTEVTVRRTNASRW